MKAKKAVKRLGKVETLLSSVIDQFAASVDGVRDLLDSAKGSVTRAVEVVNQHSSSTAASKKPPVKAQETKRRGISAQGRKRLSIAAKKRWAIAKRKGISAVTGRPLSKTA